MFFDTHNGKVSLIIPIEQLENPGVRELVNKLLQQIPSHIQIPASVDAQLLDLQFFNTFNTIEKQEVLREAIRSLVKEDHAISGKDFVSLYIADSYLVGTEKLRKRYGNFFRDIDVLLPGVLVKADQSQTTNSKRYKRYVQMLTRECHKWFILDGKLPPPEEWTSKIYVYHVSIITQRNVQQETASMLRGFIT